MTNRPLSRLQASSLTRKRSASTDTLSSMLVSITQTFVQTSARLASNYNTLFLHLQVTPLVRDESRVSKQSSIPKQISPPLMNNMTEPINAPTTPIIKRVSINFQLNYFISIIALSIIPDLFLRFLCSRFKVPRSTFAYDERPTGRVEARWTHSLRLHLWQLWAFKAISLNLHLYISALFHTYFPCTNSKINL